VRFPCYVFIFRYDVVSLKLGDQCRPNRCYPFILDWPILLYMGLALSNLSEMQSPFFFFNFCSKVCY